MRNWRNSEPDPKFISVVQRSPSNAAPITKVQGSVGISTGLMQEDYVNPKFLGTAGMFFSIANMSFDGLWL